ncbi:MAG: class I SAM-dependent methyltransferase [Myxococcota bacterium]
MDASEETLDLDRNDREFDSLAEADNGIPSDHDEPSVPHRRVRIRRPRRATAAAARAGAPSAFDQWCRTSLYTPTVIEATALLEEYCDLQLQAVYRTLGLHDILDGWSTGADVADRLGFVPSADITMHGLLYRLARRTSVVTMRGGGLSATFSRGQASTGPTQRQAQRQVQRQAKRLAEIRAALTALGPDFPASIDFLDFGVDKYQTALRDDPDFMDRLLSGRDDEFAPLWWDATNRDPLQDLHGRMGAEAIAARWTSGRILEIGGGTGNGIRHLLRRLAATDELHRIERYIFTDISTRFIMGTRKEIRRDYPDLKADWKFLDLYRPLRESRIPTEDISLIYAVNAAHVAKDIVAFLRDCHGLLAPGGMVMFAERVRIDPFEMAPRELPLNLSIYHRTATTRSAHRPMHTYLSPEHWCTVLKMAGFRPEILPNLPGMAEHFEQQYAAVIVGHKIGS